jgi:hypothetical protein
MNFALPFPEMTATEQRVYYEISWRHGQQYAIPIAEIQRHTGLSERTIKDAVRTLRLAHLQPIASRRQPPYGYFMIGTAAELEETVHAMRSQAIEELRVCFALLGRNRSRLRELLGQMEIEVLE